MLTEYKQSNKQFEAEHRDSAAERNIIYLSYLGS